MGLTFTHGEAHTDDAFLASRLQSRGYTVAADESVGGEAVPDTGEAPEAPQDFLKMTVDALKNYAAENGIDLSGAKTKSDIIAVISAANVSQADVPEAE